MILIRRKSDNLVCYEFEDSNTVAIDGNGTTADGLLLSWATSTRYEIVTAAAVNPAGNGYFRGYSFDGSSWVEVDTDIRTDFDARRLIINAETAAIISENS
jgi:hypothetical protein